MTSRGNGYALALGIGASAGSSIGPFSYAAAGGPALNARRRTVRTSAPGPASAVVAAPAVAAPWWREHVLLIVAGVAAVGAVLVWKHGH